jgi:hypothetical protein
MLDEWELCVSEQRLEYVSRNFHCLVNSKHFLEVRAFTVCGVRHVAQSASKRWLDTRISKSACGPTSLDQPIPRRFSFMVRRGLGRQRWPLQPLGVWDLSRWRSMHHSLFGVSPMWIN